MQETAHGFLVEIPPENSVETKVDPSIVEPKKPLTKRQKMVRAKNKLAKQSRKKNRN